MYVLATRKMRILNVVIEMRASPCYRSGLPVRSRVLESLRKKKEKEEKRGQC